MAEKFYEIGDDVADILAELEKNEDTVNLSFVFSHNGEDYRITVTRENGW